LVSEIYIQLIAFSLFSLFSYHFLLVYFSGIILTILEISSTVSGKKRYRKIVNLEFLILWLKKLMSVVQFTVKLATILFNKVKLNSKVIILSKNICFRNSLIHFAPAFYNKQIKDFLIILKKWCHSQIALLRGYHWLYKQRYAILIKP